MNTIKKVFSDSEDEFLQRLFESKLEQPTLTRPKEQEVWLLSRLFPSNMQVNNKNIIEMEDDPVLENFIKCYQS